VSQQPPIIIDVDDLIDEQQIVDHLLPLREGVPGLTVTAYSVPNRLGPVHELAKRYPWIKFAIHGFEHTFAECGAWTSGHAHYYIETALSMGYDYLFKPPNWIFDGELEEACCMHNVVLHHHEKDEPRFKGLLAYPGTRAKRQGVGRHIYLHTHILRNPSTTWIGDHPSFTVENLKAFDLFLSPIQKAIACE